MNEENPFDSFPDLGQLAAAMAATAGEITINDVAQACPDYRRALKAIHPVKSAATFGALLLQARLQPNCLRLELLVHLAVAEGRGGRAPDGSLLTQGYSTVGSVCGHLEDPPEDIFVGNIYSQRGNYRVVQGIWECGTFYLQRFVNLVDSLPADGDFARIADSVHALLAVSDLVCSRAGLMRNQLGNLFGEQMLPRKLAEKSSQLRRLVEISRDELQRHGIAIDDLKPFIFPAAHRTQLSGQSVGNSDLEAKPLAVDGDRLYLLLPTAVSVAIRLFLISTLASRSGRQLFLTNLGVEYSRMFDLFPTLGGKPAFVSFSHQAWGAVGYASQQVDSGRYLNLVCFLDTLEGFEHDRFCGAYLGNEDFHREVRRTAAAMQEDISRRPGFRDGVTLIVGCGIGRGAALEEMVEPRENWEVDFLGAPDFFTLSRARDVKPLSLWRILRMRKTLKEENVVLYNVNGLLNLYAWADLLDGHLVPHAEIPDPRTDASLLHLPVVQNCLVDLRHRTAVSNDCHVEQFVDGRWRMLVKIEDEYFEEDRLRPTYVHPAPDDGGRPVGAQLTRSRCWWYDLRSPDDGPDTATFDRWNLIGTWLSRAAEPLERAFGRALGQGAVLWLCVFEEPQEVIDEAPDSVHEPAEAISVEVDEQWRTVRLRIGAGFDQAIFHPENIAERALVAAFVSGVARLAAATKVDLASIVGEIVPNTQARYSHRFTARYFRDFLPELNNREPVGITRLDDAAAKLGLGWRARSRDAGGRIEGKDECVAFLNLLVARLEADLCEQLRAFNRPAMLEALMLNHEIASASRERWHRTAAAVLALRDDKVSALRVLRNHEFKLNAVLQSARNLMEMAVCESALHGGLTPGELDISTLLAKAAQIFHIGGYSDLIRWEFMQPALIVRPLGDVHANHDFTDTVMEGYGGATSDYRYMHSVQNYAKNLDPPRVEQEASDAIEDAFLSAWREEFGADFEAYRRFVDALENWAVEHGEAVIHVSKSKLIALADSPETGKTIVDSLTLALRPSWRVPPEGFDSRDLAPWRFRRRLGMLRRPLLQVDDNNDPGMMVAPGLLREAFAATFTNYYNASYPDRHLGPAMRRYAGFARQRDGMRFNQEVSARMEELGWKVQREVNVTKIIRKSTDRNYGDVDVLAWDVKSRRVLIVECKDLQFRKTLGEIAEQLSDFRGETSADGKRRDLLRKHLDRVEVLQLHRLEVASYLELENVASMESIIVFKHPVPMQFVDGPIHERAMPLSFSELGRLALN